MYLIISFLSFNYCLGQTKFYDHLSIITCNFNGSENFFLFTGNKVLVKYKMEEKIYDIQFYTKEGLNFLAFKTFGKNENEVLAFNLLTEEREVYRVYDSLSMNKGIKFISKEIRSENIKLPYDGFEIYNEIDE